MEAKYKLPATQNFMESLSDMNKIYLELEVGIFHFNLNSFS